MFADQEQLLNRFPSLRRYFANGFHYRPERDAPKFGLVCLESANQRLFVEPESGYFRTGRTVRH